MAESKEKKVNVSPQMKLLREAMDDANKKFGEASVFKITEEFREPIKAISSSSFSLNEALGVGGIAKGRIIQIAGAYSSGKTMLAIDFASHVQKEGGIVYYIDAEHSYDPVWANVLGIDSERMIVSQTNDGKEIFELINHLLDSPKWIEAKLNLIILDSVACIVPPREASSEIGKSNIALLAGFLPPELRRITPKLSNTNISLIGINQVRTNPGQMFGNPEETPGGSTFKHACTQMIHTATVGGKDSYILNENNERIGHKMRIKIDKNKVATPFRQAEFDIIYEKGIDNKRALLDLAIKYQIITQSSSKKYVFDKWEWTGRSNVEIAIASDENIYKQLVDVIAKHQEEKFRIKENE